MQLNKNMRILFKAYNHLKRIIVSLLEKFFKKLPIVKNTVYFISFRGKYCDSPKYVSEKIHEMDKDILIIWSLSSIDKRTSRPNYIKKITYNSIKDIYYRSCSEVVVDNVVGLNSRYIEKGEDYDKINNKIKKKKRLNQLNISTWHGTPLKKMVKDTPNSNIINFATTLDELYWGDNHTLKIMKSVLYDKVTLLKLGVPRNDILLNMNDESIIKLKDKLSLPTHKKILLFAPTFRDDNINCSGLMQLEEIDFDKLFESLAKKFGSDWVVVCRFHYHVEREINWSELDKKSKGKIINGNSHEDMAEYLAVSDILLSDYSSAIFDFALTKRPIFLFCPDIIHYENEERGFYMDIRNMPFSFAQDFENLLNNVDSFNNIKYTNEINMMFKRFESMNDGYSSYRIAKRIIAYLRR